PYKRQCKEYDEERTSSGSPCKIKYRKYKAYYDCRYTDKW
ncbi:unnamed protein product, partial [marine sediment metagenome]